MTLFDSVSVAIVALLIFRDDLQHFSVHARQSGVPVLSEATAMIASYLAAEQDLGGSWSLAATAAFAPALIGAAHPAVRRSEGHGA